jgi:RNA polymerase sigma factor for flagellar operon FliA
MEPSAQGGGARRVDLEELFLSALPDVEAAVGFIARRNRLSAAEAEEFAAEARLALIDRDYRILAAFQGRSRLKTYLVTVLQRVFLDLQRRRLGKWRPSAEAVRLGPTAERLERLLYRDGRTLGEALTRVETRSQIWRVAFRHGYGSVRDRSMPRPKIREI